jgi:hypothetical protein
MSEVTWDNFGAIATQNGFTFLYSGHKADEGPVRHHKIGLLVKLQKGVSLNGIQSLKEF